MAGLRQVLQRSFGDTQQATMQLFCVWQSCCPPRQGALERVSKAPVTTAGVPDDGWLPACDITTWTAAQHRSPQFAATWLRTRLGYERSKPITKTSRRLSEATAQRRVRYVMQHQADDGGVAALTAADVLESHGWRGFFFITTDLIGTPGFLTGRQVRLLSERGHTIGSHSCSHPDVFRALSAVEMQNEWSHSRDKLQQLLGHPVRCASVPGGDIDTATIEQASAAGLKHVFTSEPTTSRWRQAETCCYGRMMMLNSTSARTLKRWLTSPGIGTLPERTVRITKSGIKKAMGPAYQRLIRKRRSQHTCGGDENTVNDSSSGDQPEERCADTSRPAGSRVVALISPGLHCQYTCAELIRAGVNLVGIVEANTKTAGLPVGTLRRLILLRLDGGQAALPGGSDQADEFVGKPAVILTDFEKPGALGRVEFKGAEWKARAEEELRPGDAAEIAAVDGITLVVRRRWIQ